MSQTSGRHLARRPGRRPAGRPTAAIVVPLALALVAASFGGYLLLNRPDKGSSCDAGRVSLQVVADPDQAGLLKQAARDYTAGAPVVNDRCVDVNVRSLDSPEAMAALASGWTGANAGPRPDVWAPASSTWALQLQLQLQAVKRHNLIPSERPSVATSPLVIAMPRPMGQALGWPQRKLGWTELIGALRNPAGWSAFRHPEWGQFKLGKTDPKLSETGLGALLGGIVTSASQNGSFKPQDLASRTTELGGLLLEISRSAGDEVDTATTFLANLQQADKDGKALGYVSAIPLTEKEVWDYNQGKVLEEDSPQAGGGGKPNVPLVAVYPKEGTLQSDYPWIVLRAPWVDEDRRAAANDLLLHLKSPKIQAMFQAAGFRSARGEPGPVLTDAENLLADQPARVMAVPPAQVVAIALRGWDQTKRIAHLLSVYDVSGSMNQVVPGTGMTRIELAKRAAASGLRLFTSESHVGLWEFSTNLDGPRDYREVVPTGPLAAQMEGGKTRYEVLEQVIGTLKATNGDTGLYDTTLAAYEFVKRDYVADRLNLVVLLTDGRNDDPGGGITLQQLLERLRQGQQDERKVRIITLGYGEDVDASALQQIAQATGGAFFASPNPADIERVFVTALANF